MAKCAKIWLSERHVADMSGTFPAKDRKSYWEAMILAITNDKFYSLRANFKQELFEQFQGKFYSI